MNNAHSYLGNAYNNPSDPYNSPVTKDTHPGTAPFPVVGSPPPYRKKYNHELSFEEWLVTPEEYIADGVSDSPYSQAIHYDEEAAYRHSSGYRDNNGTIIDAPLRSYAGTRHKTRFGASWKMRLLVMTPLVLLLVQTLLGGYA